MCDHFSEKTAVVLYDFYPEEGGEMLVRKGDTITVNGTTDEWCFGKRFEARGYIPSSYVKILENVDLRPSRMEIEDTTSGLL